MNMNPDRSGATMGRRARRLTLNLTDDDTLRVIGLHPGVVGASEVWGVLTRYADLVADAALAVEARLRPAEWEYLAEALAACPALVDVADAWASSVPMILAHVDQAHRTSRLGDRRFGRARGDARVAALSRKLAKMGPLEGEAILAAVRYGWSLEVPGSEPRWYAVDNRRRGWPEAAGHVRAGGD